MRAGRELIKRLAMVGAVFGVAAVAIDAHAQNLERGRALYENHCRHCHTPDVHGRPGRPPLSVDELRDVVVRWQRNQGLDWSAEEVGDVVHFLAVEEYRTRTSLDGDRLAGPAAGWR